MSLPAGEAVDHAAPGDPRGVDGHQAGGKSGRQQEKWSDDQEDSAPHGLRIMTEITTARFRRLFTLRVSGSSISSHTGPDINHGVLFLADGFLLAAVYAAGTMDVVAPGDGEVKTPSE